MTLPCPFRATMQESLLIHAIDINGPGFVIEIGDSKSSAFVGSKNLFYLLNGHAHRCNLLTRIRVC